MTEIRSQLGHCGRKSADLCGVPHSAVALTQLVGTLVTCLLQISTTAPDGALARSSSVTVEIGIDNDDETCRNDYRRGSLWGIVSSVTAVTMAEQTESGDVMLATVT